MKLLKIGSLNNPRNRWMDALDCFDTIYVFCSSSEKCIENEKIQYIKLNLDSHINRFLKKVLLRVEQNIKYNWLSFFIIFLFKLYNHKILSTVLNKDFEYVHCSYNDFDESALFMLMLGRKIRTHSITRAYKETRMHYSYLEKKSFEMSDRVVLNNIANKKVFEDKYGKEIFNKKKIILNLDEDFRSANIISKVELNEKYSDKDGKKHVVILAGRVFSDNKNVRSGSRLYYIPLIVEFIKNDFIVHLHTLHIYSDENGINHYEKLSERYPENFYIEEALDFDNRPIESYKILSKYDYGILHNFIKGTENSEFDRVNIPHRYYEYQIAQVIPIVKKGNTKVIEKIFKDTNSGIVYNDIQELSQIDDGGIHFLKPSFKFYITYLYDNIICDYRE